MKNLPFPVAFLIALLCSVPALQSQKSYCSESASSTAEAIANNAESYIGSTDWAYTHQAKKVWRKYMEMQRICGRDD